MSITHAPLPYHKIVYLFQGGGALGAYQAGVFEGLSACNRPPDWMIGTSVGAINAAIIAGNHPENRVAKLKEFWGTVSSPLSNFIMPTDNDAIRKWVNLWYTHWTIIYGQPGFFKPRLTNPWLDTKSSPDKISFYDTAELKKTIERLVDFEIINQRKVRLTLGCVRLEDDELVYFDNKHHDIGSEHIMASAALPPGFPAVKIEGKYYWDGGISSNTPLSVVLADLAPEKLLCFIVNLFSSREELPKSMLDVLKRRKDIEFAGRYESMLAAFCELNHLKHTIHELRKGKETPSLLNKSNPMTHFSALNLVKFHYRDRTFDLWSKDFEFSRQSIQEHYQMGYNNVQNALKNPSWLDVIPDNASIVRHNF